MTDGQPWPVDGAAQPDAPDADAERVADFEELLRHLKRTRGFDFTGYKRASLTRRVDLRMQTIGVVDYPTYIDYLEVHPDEFDRLFDAVLINVTAFFRDPESWEYVGREVLPRILEAKGENDSVRAWSVGCASGEEAYTIAILLAEAMGIEAFRERAKIYATDADDDALARARQATYTAEQVRNVPAELIDRYFEPSAGGRFTFRADLRRAVIFGRHDLTRDAPISRVDLLACRNTLMYFNAETQARVLGRFALALNDSGVLVLGRAETLLSRTNLFAPISLKRRVFGKLTRQSRRGRAGIDVDQLVGAAARGAEPRHGRSRDAAFDANPVAQVVVDGDSRLVAANARARALFAVSPADIGRPLQDLEISYRPVELRSRIDELYLTRSTVTVTGVSWPLRGEPRTYEVQLAVLDAVGEPGTLGVGISFTDTTAFSRLQQELEQANHELETAYEELQSTNEELETMNEELQSTVEELETTNEELQSTNEALETMNEELQSTNEELETMNDEMRRRSVELEDVNLYLEAVLASLRGGVVVLDPELRVTAWNDQSAEYWGVRSEEAIGRNFFNLDIGLPMDALHQPIRSCVAGEAGIVRVTLDATNRRGRAFRCQVSCMPLRVGDSAVRGVIITVEE